LIGDPAMIDAPQDDPGAQPTDSMTGIAGAGSIGSFPSAGNAKPIRERRDPSTRPPALAGWTPADSW